MILEHEVESWDKFNKKAKYFIDAGLTNVSIKDKLDISNYPSNPMLGYIFSDPFDENDGDWVMISAINFKNTAPELIRKAFQTESGRIGVAKVWGNYVEREQDPNVEELSFEEMEEIAKNGRMRFELKEYLMSYNISLVDDHIEDILDGLLEIIEKEK